jgi:hypothetical protein
VKSSWIADKLIDKFRAPLQKKKKKKKRPLFDVLKPWSKKPRQNFLTWQRLKRQKSSL